MNITITLPSEIVEFVIEQVTEKVIERLAADRGASETEYLSVKDAGVYLGCTEGRVRKLIERRRIPFTQDGPGCRVFLSRRELDSWMSEAQTGGVSRLIASPRGEGPCGADR